MSFDNLQRTAFFVFALFLIFTAIVLLIGGYETAPVISVIIFIALLYAAYYILLKNFF